MSDQSLKNSKNTLDAAIPKAGSNLSEEEKKALELKEQAEHESGPRREDLQQDAVEKSE